MRKAYYTLIILGILLSSSTVIQSYDQSNNNLEVNEAGIIKFDNYRHFSNGKSTINEIIVRNSTIFIADGADGVKIVNASNPSNVETLWALSYSEKVANIELAGNSLFVGLDDQIYVYNISQLTSPVKLAVIDVEYHFDILYNDGLVYVSSFDKVTIFQFNNQTGSLNYYSEFLTLDYLLKMQVVNNTLFAAEYWEGFSSYNVTNLSNITRISNIQAEDPVHNFAIKGKVAYLGISSVNITNINNMTMIDSYELYGNPGGMDIEGDILYQSNLDGSVSVFNITSDGYPEEMDFHSYTRYLDGIEVEKDIFYAYDSHYGIFIANATDGDLFGVFNPPSNHIEKTIIQDDLAIIHSDNEGIWIFNITDASVDPVLTPDSEFEIEVIDIAKVGNYIYVQAVNRLFVTQATSDGLNFISDFIISSKDIEVTSENVLISYQGQRVETYDTSDPTIPTLIDSFTWSGFKNFQNVAYSDNYILLMGRYEAPLYLSHTNFGQIEEIGESVDQSIGENHHWGAISGNILYVKSYDKDIEIYDLSSLHNGMGNLELIKTIPGSMNSLFIELYGNILFYSNQRDIIAHDVGLDPTLDQESNEIYIPFLPVDIEIFDGSLGISHFQDGFSVLDFSYSLPETPQIGVSDSPMTTTTTTTKSDIISSKDALLKLNTFYLILPTFLISTVYVKKRKNKLNS